MRKTTPEPIGPPDVASAPPSGVDRRDFLKAAGFTLAGVTAACRRGPVERAMPFLEQPEGMVPGKALWYASACGACPAGCGTLVKTRDGRPIKLEGNPDHPLSEGGLCAVGQASVLGLYDSERLGAPLRGGEAADWAAVDREVPAALHRIARQGGRVRLLTGTIHGPTERAAVEGFLADLRGRGADARHAAYDGLSSSAILDAHEITHGARALPRYRFDRAEVVASFDADYLGTWISPVEHAAGWRKRRSSERGDHGEGPRSHCVQLEGRMSLTGTKADRRLRLLPGETGAALAHVAARVAERAGAEPLAVAPGGSPLDPALLAELTELADRLWAARGRSLVVSGSQDRSAQVLVNHLNHLLGSYGATLDLARPSHQRQGDDRAIEELLAEIEAGSVDALLVRGVDPVAELPYGSGGHALAAALEGLPLTVAFSRHLDETARAARWVCPEPHFLETWRDGEPVAGVVALGQPAIRPLGGTRPFIETLGAWTAPHASASAYERIRAHWRQAVYPRRADPSLSFQHFWDLAVHDGVARLRDKPREAPLFRPASAAEAVLDLPPAESLAQGRYALALFPQVGILDGRGAENPWLQELPDPVTKTTWGNHACLSPDAARALGLEDGAVVRIAFATPPDHGGPPAREPLELPVVVQPGQHDRLVAVALGYGRPGTARFAGVGPHWIESRPTVAEGEAVGVNASPYLALEDGALRYHRTGLAVHATGRAIPLAQTQRWGSLEVPEGIASGFLARAGERRDVVREVGPEAEAHGHDASHHPSLWAEHAYPGRHWAMVVDLDACTGCSACVVACQAENNVPVVGRDEVVRQREMHWLRIDRYYSGAGDAVSAAHQPMLCQHCDNAPCESVCPVLATVHSAEGLNQQVYNRCVGTRYCANNCPYKVRRFNWFAYAREDRLQNLVLNPDVVVRSRGVMEKCSFCVQRIQEAKGAAKAAGRELADGDVTTACEQSCPARAITFGDAADLGSRVARQLASERAYRVLEELNVKPSVSYLAVVRDREEETHRG